MVEIGGRPILWHIMKHYAHYGLDDFVIALGYKGEYIKRWFVDYAHLAATSPCARGPAPSTCTTARATTGRSTSSTPARRTEHRRAHQAAQADYVGDETFMLTWGDGVSQRRPRRAARRSTAAHGKLATLTAVRPPARFGHLETRGRPDRRVLREAADRRGLDQRGVLRARAEVFDYIDGDETQWEHEPLEHLAKDGQLMAYRHDGFWQCMDTLRDKKLLEELWDRARARGRSWTD